MFCKLTKDEKVPESLTGIQLNNNNHCYNPIQENYDPKLSSCQLGWYMEFTKVILKVAACFKKYIGKIQLSPNLHLIFNLQDTTSVSTSRSKWTENTTLHYFFT
jgi:hypothetical protein